MQHVPPPPRGDYDRENDNARHYAHGITNDGIVENPSEYPPLWPFFGGGGRSYGSGFVCNEIEDVVVFPTVMYRGVRIKNDKYQIKVRA